MDHAYREAYEQLNEAQKQAVDTIDGPVMVVAGPGTGKTQLLGMRVANIMRTTDTAPSNILCLTFTDNAARNMRERLETIIGPAAYHVPIHTFHSFGGEVINQYADYFTARQLLQPVDELGRYELLKDIFEGLPHSNPLSAQVGGEFIFLTDALAVISWLKQNAVAPAELHQIVTANQQFMATVADELAACFSQTPSPKRLTDYQRLLKSIKKQVTGRRYYGFPEYAGECAAELQQAIESTSAEGRYAPAMTTWRNNWCQKDASGQHVFKDAGRNIRKLHALAGVYEKLLERMSNQGLYDFDDMIMEVVHSMEANDDLRFSLQERYQYVLVDEFQDTNKAQLRMLAALGDNPLFEGRPNIMAVGDDDQAIYAFQGAEVSNMVAFTKLYRQPNLITLGDNYRSTAEILTTSFAIADQITDRLEASLPDTHKQLTSHNRPPAGLLEQRVFSSELAEYDWLAEQIAGYIKDGWQPADIAVIAPRHKYLERLMPYLGHQHIPVAYERREDILQAPIIKQLLTMAKLVVAIADNRHNDVDALISQVLGYEFWEIPIDQVLELSLECFNSHQHWLPTLLKQTSNKLSTIASWLVGLAQLSSLEPLEYIIDQLLGSLPSGRDMEYEDPSISSTTATSGFVSPMRDFYFNPKHYEQSTDNYLTLLGQLSTLRQRLRQWKPTEALYIKDLMEFTDLHNQAHIKIVDSNPHTQTTNAVQVMTAYKAKGLEFGIVFVINAQDEVWGPTARHRTERIALPRNLPIAPAGTSDNDKLRLLFVALTRAKDILHLTSYTHDLDNKLSPGLSFIGGNAEPGSAIVGLTPHFVDEPTSRQAIEILSTDWAYRFRQVIADKETLLAPILDNYKLSVTHLNNFLDVPSGGPWYFGLHNLLRFPEAPIPAAAYGDAVHRTIQWVYAELRQTDKIPDILKIQDYFVDLLSRKHLREVDYNRLEERGRLALLRYFKERGRDLQARDIIERGFNNEGVLINKARLSGKIDKLHFLNDVQVQVVDYKTGKPAESWHSRDDYERRKLHRYRQQLLFYKLLVEHSASFTGKLTVTSGALEFIELNDQDKLVNNLELVIESDELQRFSRLIQVVWQHIMALNFPAVDAYPKSSRGTEQFEQDLLDGKL